MKAMILAAGRGKRLRPLTDTTPKPLIKVGAHALIEYHLYALAKVGISEVVINVAYQTQQFLQMLDDGKRYGVKILYSFEPESGGLETGGGILQALPLLGNEPFLLVNGDIWTDYPFTKLVHFNGRLKLAHIVLVDNPKHNLKGDFHLHEENVLPQGEKLLTLAGINIYHPKLFAHCQPGYFSVVPLLIQAMQENNVTGEHYQGQWMDAGTPESLQQLKDYLHETHQ